LPKLKIKKIFFVN